MSGVFGLLKVIGIQIIFQINNRSCSTVKPVVIGKKGVSIYIKIDLTHTE